MNIYELSVLSGAWTGTPLPVTSNHPTPPTPHAVFFLPGS